MPTPIMATPMGTAQGQQDEQDAEAGQADLETAHAIWSGSSKYSPARSSAMLRPIV